MPRPERTSEAYDDSESRVDNKTSGQFLTWKPSSLMSDMFRVYGEVCRWWWWWLEEKSVLGNGDGEEANLTFWWEGDDPYGRGL